MGWQEYIHSDPNVLSGKPVVKGTRLSVEFLTDGEASKVVFAPAAEHLREGSIFLEARVYSTGFGRRVASGP